MKISMVSEHASPLAALGGVDAGGQNVHVAALSAALARRGHTVTVYTRKDSPELPPRVKAGPRLEVVHVEAGPASHVPKDELRCICETSFCCYCLFPSARLAIRRTCERWRASMDIMPR